jgi:hypothetical protein
MAAAGTPVLQLLEHIPRALLAVAGAATAAAAAAAASTPLFYLSPAAPDALATASSCCEYLELPRKQAVLFSGQAPFEFDRQLESGQLRLFTGVVAEEEEEEATADAATTAAGARDGAAEAAAEGLAAGKLPTNFDEALQQVQAAGPCVVFVPLWSLAAGKFACQFNGAFSIHHYTAAAACSQLYPCCTCFDQKLRSAARNARRPHLVACCMALHTCTYTSCDADSCQLEYHLVRAAAV